MKNKKPVVFVGLSGGVDSSVAAWRLKQAGYKVVGVFIKVWHPEFMVCNWEAERLDAMRVAAHLEIPFLTCDAEADYKQEVADYFIAEYQAGRTPNPDVMCNQHIKFGAFLRFAREHGADFIATGHYARREDKNGQPALYRGKDTNKDQSYFLWTLSHEQLQATLLPIGNSTKEVIRQEAEQIGLPTATKKDSQGICFLGHIDIPEFMSHYFALQSGAVLNEVGEVIGQHQGAVIYTVGQRHGFTIDTKNDQRQHYYVLSRDIENNTITVGVNKPVIASSEKIILREIVLREAVEVGAKLEIQTRYRQTPFLAEVVAVTTEEIYLSVKDTVTETASVGQSCVLYRGELCLGGGIIS